MQNYHIVGIADIISFAERFFHKMIKPIKILIYKQLRCQISNRDTN